MSGLLSRDALAATLALGAAVSAAFYAQAQDDIVGTPFVERFASIDEERWAISHGWANGPWMASAWSAQQVSLGEQGLDIVLARRRASGRRFASGEVQSAGVYERGYFETHMQVPRGSGLVSGFFTYAAPDPRGHWDEIDIEILGCATTEVQFTIFHGGGRRSVTLPLGFDAADAMHTYGFDWAPGRIRWYVDGALLHEETGTGLPTQPQHLIVHLWNSDTMTDWLGPIDAAGASWTLRVACVAQAERYGGRPICAPPPKR